MLGNIIRIDAWHRCWAHLMTKKEIRAEIKELEAIRDLL